MGIVVGLIVLLIRLLGGKALNIYILLKVIIVGVILGIFAELLALVCKPTRSAGKVEKEGR